jgi:thiol-disulfide isomerase/thioredoxin
VKSRPGYILFFILVLLITGREVRSQEISYINIPDLDKLLKAPENKLYVVNFWATWCAPCIAELPGFQKISKEYDPEKVSFIMVSLDFPGQVQKQLVPFLKKNMITLDVRVMTDLDYNAWIEKVDPSWQGNIPATLFFNNSRKTRFFHAGEIDESGLRKFIDTCLN